MDTLGNDSAPDGTLPEGYALGRYTIVRALGEGGMGAVYEAVHGDLEKRVAVKTLHRAVALDAVVRARFLQEPKAASRIRHPHIVDVSDVGIHGDVPYLVMELLEGEDLRARFKREGALDVQALLSLMLPVLAALKAVHEEGVVHRDLKPENIFLARTRDRVVVPKVLDFGISKVSPDDNSPGITGSSSMLGTPFYMAPEQATNARDVDARADLYALGVILYEGLTGAVPYSGHNLFTVLTAASRGDCAPPRSRRPSIPEGLEAAVLRAMSIVPSDRFTDAPTMARALLPFASSEARARWADAFDAERAPDVDRVAASAPLAVTVLGGPVSGVTLAGASMHVAEATPTGSPRPRRILGASVLTTVALVVSLTLWRGGASETRPTTPRLTSPVAVAPAPTERPAPTVVTVAIADAGGAAVAPMAAAAVVAPARAPQKTRTGRVSPPRVVRPGRAPAVTSVNDAPIVD